MSRRGLTLLLLIGLLSFSVVHAEENCDSVEECTALLEQYEAKIQEYQGNINVSQTEQKTLNNQIYLLRQQIDQSNYKIKKSDIVIHDIQDQVVDTVESIEETGKKILSSRDKLGLILRKVHEEDQRSSLEIFLGNDSLSGFFDNMFALERLLLESHELLKEIEGLKTNLEVQKVELSTQEQEWEEWKQVQILQKSQSQGYKEEQEWLLQQTKGEEALYQKLLQENQAKANQIRQRLFSLAGIVTSNAPTFGEALEIARYVEGVTGVRAALVLAVLTQESNIGKNVGQCYLRDFDTGAGVVVSSGRYQDRIMKPSRDITPFLSICEESGRDPSNTRVSCPMSYGYGGAMGPAQFIPSTWVIYRERVANTTGRPADPWNIRDAFLAAGFYLRDSGAWKQTEDAEWCAAMVYFSGSCYSGHNFYGNSVLALANRYEEDISQLDTYGSN